MLGKLIENVRVVNNKLDYFIFFLFIIIIILFSLLDLDNRLNMILYMIVIHVMITYHITM